MRTFGYVSGLSLLLALGFASGEVQAQAAVCDEDGNGYISANEADDCAGRDYDALLGSDGDGLSEEDFTSAYDAETYSTVDADGDGMVSREEYVAWRQEEFGAALGGSEEMPNADFEDLHAAGVMKSQGADSQTPGSGSGGVGGSGGAGGAGGSGGSGNQ